MMSPLGINPGGLHCITSEIHTIENLMTFWKVLHHIITLLLTQNCIFKKFYWVGLFTHVKSLFTHVKSDSSNTHQNRYSDLTCNIWVSVVCYKYSLKSPQKMGIWTPNYLVCLFMLIQAIILRIDDLIEILKLNSSPRLRAKLFTWLCAVCPISYLCTIYPMEK